MLNCSTRSLLFAGALSFSLGACSSAFAGGKQQPVNPQQTVQQAAAPPAQAGDGRHVHLPVDPAPAPLPADIDAPLIQVAILLDTSNSMDGLIDQAKAQLWMIVNRFAKAQRDGEEPNFQIALFEYGNTNLPAEEGYIRQIVPFTNDLDSVSQALFALRTRGGDEYCGQVIDEALTRLPWSPNANDFKAIYIAGNEAFTQGPVFYVGVAKRAVDKGVLVNTIHCGPEHKGIQGKWQHGAQLTGGSFLTINQDRSVKHDPAPQDDSLRQLNAHLNQTYIPFGRDGAQAQARQEAADLDNEKLSNDAAAGRAVSKAGKYYKNSGWDLVDASDEKDFKLEDVKEDALPDNLKDKTLAERKAYIAEMKAKRAQIKAQIAKLAAERAAHVAEDRARRADQEGASLGEAVNDTVDEQLEASGFEVEKDEPKPEPEPAPEKNEEAE